MNTWDASEPARLALSAVYRTGQRFGVNHLIDVLRGAENDRIIQFDHHNLGVYGKGKDLDNNQWRSVFRQLVARNLLSVDVEGFGGLRLEESCRALLRGEEGIALRRDEKTKATKKTKGSKAAAPVSGDIDPALFEALRACRLKLAEDQKVPPYVIFHNTTLEDMCRLRPRTLAEFGMVSGVGERKKEKYGPVFLAVLDATAE